MPADPFEEIRQLAESHGLTYSRLSDYHCRVAGAGAVVDSWPTGKKRAAKKGEEVRRGMLPWDVVKWCLRDSPTRPAKLGRKERGKPKGYEDNGKVITNPAGIKHFWDGSGEPPWDDAAPFEWVRDSDGLRVQARRLEDKAQQLRAAADELDDQQEKDSA